MFTLYGKVLPDFIKKAKQVTDKYGGSVIEHRNFFEYGHVLIVFNPLSGCCYVWSIVPSANTDRNGYYQPWAFKNEQRVDLILV